MNGTAIQNQYLSGTGTYNLADLTVNNTFATSPSLTLNKDVNVSGALALTSGIVYTTSTNILALGTAASSGSGSASSFVSGPMSKVGASNFVFPVGKGTKWRRTAVTNISSSSTFTAEYFNSAYSNTTPVNSPLNNVSTMEYWQVDRSTGSGNANLTLYWEDATGSGINDCSDLTIARWSGSIWEERPGTASGTCSGTGTGSVVSNSLITSFSPFTFGSKSGTVNPLPIELLDFTANKNGNTVDLKWATATETNNDYFTVEKTKDFHSYKTVCQIDGAGNSNTTIHYQSADPLPYSGISYYRLKQTDFNGAFTYSSFATIDFNSSTDFSFDVYPNPNEGNQANIILYAQKDMEISVVVYDISGKECYSKISTTHNDGENIFTVNPVNKLSAGVYLVTISAKGKTYRKRLIVR